MRTCVGLVFLLVGAMVGAQTLRVGVATGFPPYQFIVDGIPKGLDIELAQALADEAAFVLVWNPGPWDDLTTILRLTKELDFLVGMEKTGERPSVFLLGRTLYTRKNVLFLLETQNNVQRLEDLAGLAVARDRDAYSEELLGRLGLKTEIRLVRTESKEDAFEALVSGRVVAAFMPEAVGWTLARRAGVAVRTLDIGDPGSPVGLAFRKDSEDLRRRFDAAADRLEKNGALSKIRDRYHSLSMVRRSD